jgi:EAL domain-containing protein (putative c-di-GMP-specific phosphodiesterase class I)
MGLLFINVHLHTLLHMRDLQTSYLRLMESSGIPPEAVVIEISERSRSETPRALSRILRGMRRRGFRFALDDFGAAYSGLQHLLWFEPEFVKLDRAFALGIDRSARKQTLVAGAVTMARKLGSQVIVEGVENSTELLTLMSLDVPMAQGFHFGRPKAAAFWASHGATSNAFSPWFSSDAGLEEKRAAVPQDPGGPH